MFYLNFVNIILTILCAELEAEFACLKEISFCQCKLITKTVHGMCCQFAAFLNMNTNVLPMIFSSCVSDYAVTGLSFLFSDLFVTSLLIAVKLFISKNSVIIWWKLFLHTAIYIFIFQGLGPKRCKEIRIWLISWRNQWENQRQQ